MARSMPDNSESEPYRLAASASHLLRRAEQLAADRFTQLVGETVTLRQFTVLAAVAENPGLSQTALGRAAGVDRSTMGDMMLRMERNGWITRAPASTDARMRSVRLSPAGATVLAAATHHARAADAAILDALPRTKRRTFLNIVTKLAKLADEAAERAEREARKQAKKQKRAQKKEAKAEAPRKPRR